MNNDSPQAGWIGRDAAEKGTAMKKGIALATAVVALAIPATSLAASGNSNASDSGATHGAFADVNDDFGFLGALGGTPYYDGSLGHDEQGEWAVGQDPGATGYNNSHVIGDPQTP
jgi:hypothetical protein